MWWTGGAGGAVLLVVERVVRAAQGHQAMHSCERVHQSPVLP